MHNLIKNELFKIFKRKTIYFFWLFVFLVLLARTIAVSTSKGENINVTLYYNKTDVTRSKKELETMNIKDEETREDYLINKNLIEFTNILHKYKKNSWQYQYLMTKEDDFNSYNREIILYENKINKDKERYEESLLNKKKLLNLLNYPKWQDVVDYENREIDKLLKSEYLEPSQKKGLELQKEVNNMRLKENIPYNNDYLNSALENYLTSSSFLNNNTLPKKDGSMKTEEKINFYHRQKEMNLKALYIIKNKEDLDSTSTTKYMLNTFFSGGDFFIVVCIALIAGTIISEEYEKGTIKNLLIKPYQREKILTSKIITSLIILFLNVGLMFLLQIILGSIFLDTNSLSLPNMIYDPTKMRLVALNPLKQFFLLFATDLPYYLFMNFSSLLVGTMFGISALALLTPFLLSIASGIVDVLFQMYNLKSPLLLIIPFIHLRLSRYLFGAKPPYLIKYLSFNVSLIISILYIIMITILTYIIFKRKDIKNI